MKTLQLLNISPDTKINTDIILTLKVLQTDLETTSTIRSKQSGHSIFAGL